MKVVICKKCDNLENSNTFEILVKKENRSTCPKCGCKDAGFIYFDKIVLSNVDQLIENQKVVNFLFGTIEPEVNNE